MSFSQAIEPWPARMTATQIFPNEVEYTTTIPSILRDDGQHVIVWLVLMQILTSLVLAWVKSSLVMTVEVLIEF